VLAESRPDQPLLIIFSDGLDTFSWLTSEAVLDTAKRNDARCLRSVNRPASEQDISARPHQSYRRVPARTESTSHLPALFLSILEEFRQRYLVSYTPQGVSESGWHKVDVRVKNRSAKISARPGYLRTSTEEQSKKSSAQAD